MTTDWHHRAACREEDPELFFPAGTTGPAVKQIRQAKAACRRCPVNLQCLQWALDNGLETGIWGGQLLDTRKAVKAKPGTSVETGTTPVDADTIDRLLNGEPAPTATDAERYYAARHLHRHAPYLTVQQIADRVRTTARTIERWKKAGWRDRTFKPDGSRIGPGLNRQTAPVETAWATKTSPTEDGHLVWTGGYQDGRPRLRHGGQSYSVRRIAYRTKHGRDPDGYPQPVCGDERCVHPDHLEDIPGGARTAAA